MRIVIDSNVIIELEKRNQQAIELMTELVKNNEELLISTVVLSEVLVGPYFSDDFKEAMAEIKLITSQFTQVDLSPEIAEKIAACWAYLIKQDFPAQYQDVAVGATFAATKSDFLITQNKKHFEMMPEIGSKARTIEEFRKIYA